MSLILWIRSRLQTPEGSGVVSLSLTSFTDPGGVWGFLTHLNFRPKGLGVFTYGSGGFLSHLNFRPYGSGGFWCPRVSYTNR
jgi:hypothetical protein